MKIRLYFILLFYFANCATTYKECSFCNYFSDRGNDLFDIVSLTAGKNLGFGVELNLSFISAGFLVENQSGDLKKYLWKDGCGISHTATSKTFILGFGSDSFGHSENYIECSNEWALRRFKLYKETTGLPVNKYGRVGAKIHFFVLSIQSEVNFLEAIDFFLGILNIDIMSDDINKSNVY
jgi:hypothetical protein